MKVVAPFQDKRLTPSALKRSKSRLRLLSSRKFLACSPGPLSQLLFEALRKEEVNCLCFRCQNSNGAS